MNKLLNVILDEQKFPYEGMNLEERNYYLNIIRNCKDIKDSEHMVDGIGVCEIIGMSFKKNNEQITINGTLSIGSKNIKEHRCIDGYIFIEKNNILVDMHITRLCVQDSIQEYNVLDEFKIVNDKLIRTSSYNYDMKDINTEIFDEIMKGKLK